MTDHLVYHQAAYDLLARHAIRSEQALHQIKAREHTLDLTFPLAVREWYAQEGAVDILLACREADEPYPIERLGYRWGRDELDPQLKAYYELNPMAEAFYDPTMILFMVDNHGGVVYAFQIDASDDPPVFTWDDSQMWTRQGDTFSRFIFLLVWEALAAEVAFQATARSLPIAASDLALLREELDPVRPALAGSPVLRFQRDDQFLVIAPFDTPGTLYWRVSAATEEGLEALERTVLRCRYSDLNPRFAR